MYIIVDDMENIWSNTLHTYMCGRLNQYSHHKNLLNCEKFIAWEPRIYVVLEYRVERLDHNERGKPLFCCCGALKYHKSKGSKRLTLFIPKLRNLYLIIIHTYNVMDFFAGTNIMTITLDGSWTIDCNKIGYHWIDFKQWSLDKIIQELNIWRISIKTLILFKSKHIMTHKKTFLQHAISILHDIYI